MEKYLWSLITTPKMKDFSGRGQDHAYACTPTGSHIHRKSVITKEMVQDRHVVHTTSRKYHMARRAVPLR